MLGSTIIVTSRCVKQRKYHDKLARAFTHLPVSQGGRIASFERTINRKLHQLSVRIRTLFTELDFLKDDKPHPDVARGDTAVETRFLGTQSNGSRPCLLELTQRGSFGLRSLSGSL